MGVVRDWWNDLGAFKYPLTGQQWFFIIAYGIPSFMFILRFLVLKYPDWRNINYKLMTDCPRPGSGAKGVVIRVYNGITPRPDLGAGLATIKAKIVQDEGSPGNVGKFVHILVEFERDQNVGSFRMSLKRLTLKLKYEGWPILEYLDTYTTLHEEESIGIMALQALRADHDDMTSAQSSFVHALLAHVGIAVGLLVMEFYDPLYGWLTLLGSLPLFGWLLPKVIYHYHEKANPHWSEHKEPFKWVMRPLPKAEQESQGNIVYEVPLKHPIIDIPIDPTDPTLFKGILSEPLPPPPPLLEVKEADLWDRLPKPEPPVIAEESEKKESWQTTRPMLSGDELSAAVELYLDTYGIEKIKTDHEKKTKEWEVRGELKDKQWSHKGHCKVSIEETEHEMKVSIVWKMRDRHGGTKKVPEAREDELPGAKREDSYYLMTRKRLDKLKMALKSGTWAKLEPIMAWSRPTWVTEIFSRLETDLQVWTELGAEKLKNGEESKPESEIEPPKTEAKPIEPPKTEAKSPVEGVPASIMDRIRHLEEQGLVAPGTPPRISRLRLHQLKERYVTKHGKSVMIIGVDTLTAEGEIVTVRNDLGSPWMSMTSILGINQWQQEIILLRHLLAMANTSFHEGMKMQFTTAFDSKKDEMEFMTWSFSRLNKLTPTFRRIMSQFLGVDMPEDLHPTAAATPATGNWPWEVMVQIPLNEKMAKSLRKHVSRVQDMVTKDVYLAILRRPGVEVVAVEDAKKS